MTRPAVPQPLVVVETYHTSQTPLAVGQPFSLAVTLRNIGAADAYRVLIEWSDASIVPLGSGMTRYIPSVPANTTTRLEGRFFVRERIAVGLYELALRITCERADGTVATRTEKLYFLIAAAPQGNGVSPAPPTVSAQPSQTVIAQPSPTPTHKPVQPVSPTPTPEPWLLRLLRALFGDWSR